MLHYETVVIALAMGPADEPLIEHSLVLAAPLGVKKIYLAHVVQPSGLPQGFPGAEALVPKQNEVQSQFEVIKQKISSVIPDVEVQFDIREGNAETNLLKLVRESSADLLCISRHHLPESTEIGPHAMKLIHKAQCSVLAVSPSLPASYKKILVGVDFSAHSLVAVKTVLQLTTKYPELIVDGYHICDVPTGYERSGSTFEEFSDSLIVHAKERWESLKLDLLDPEDTLNMHFFTIPHEDRRHAPGRYLAKAAEKFHSDLIICGSKGMSSLMSLFVGSVTEGVLRHTTKTTLCVKQKGETIGFLNALFGPEW